MSATINFSTIGEKLKQNEAQDLKNSQFISEITSRKYEFVTVIESLSDVLTNQDVVIRERGVSFLTWILMEVPPDLFSGQEITAVVNFYCDRLKDHPMIASATIKGLLALVKMKNIQKESLVQIVMPLFRETDCQILDKTDRYNVFSIVAYLVENHFDIVATMGFDFVFGIISVSDGETDPLNLFLLFRFLPTFLRNINLGHLMEETFGLLSCYFPIDYNATNEVCPVSRKDLSEGLMNCLVARSDFADLCIPLIFEKLESSAKISKTDSYMLLGAACSTFSAESVSKHSSEIWKIMKKDILPPTDSHICDVALQALSEIVKLFSSPESDQQLKNFLDLITKGLKKYLDDVEGNMFHPAINIIKAVCSKSIPAAKYVLSHLRFFVNNVTICTPDRKKITLLSLSPFIPIIKAPDIANSNENDLKTVFNDISQFHISSLSCESSEVQKLALVGLQELVDNFNNTLRSELMEAIVDNIKHEWFDNRVEFLKILRQLARVAPDEMLEFVKNFKLTKDASSEKLDLKTLAFTISAIASEEGMTQYAVPRLINIITNSDCFDHGLLYLLNSINTFEDNQFLNKIDKDYSLAETLIAWWTNDTGERELSDYNTVENLSEIIALIVRCQEISSQRSIIVKFIPLLFDGLEVNSSESNVFLIEAILSSAEHIEIFDQFPHLGLKVITFAVKSKDEKIITSSSRLLASIANKMSDNLPNWLITACDEIFSSLNDTTPINDKQRNVALLNWIIKGLLLADSPHLATFIPKWFDLMEREDVGRIVAYGFKTVLKEETLYLNIESHNNVKILYRQKFFTYLPTLMSKFESSSSPYKSNYLLALIQLIQAVPKHVAATQMTNIVIILSLGLDTGDPETIFVSTTILEQFLKDKETILVNYIYTFIPKFLKLSKYFGHMNIRMNALKCLFFYAFYPTVSILPLRREVIKSLQSCLDDRKRLVRSEAVRSRNRWFLVGAPGENDIYS